MVFQRQTKAFIQIINNNLNWVQNHHQSWSCLIKVVTHGTFKSHRLDICCRGCNSQGVYERQNGTWRTPLLLIPSNVYNLGSSHPLT